ncbi:site-specific DNA-methyltransferase [Sedimentibacter sp. LTW-03]|uniref:site-specific DNA-methyltransferase n=1 Tax=Sedimentibacter sp. LTW-03 TaxID=3453406 RepID=UPI003F84655B
MSNLSKKKRNEMISFIEKLREEHTDDASVIALNEIESFITEKRYGLVWEEHAERVDEEMTHNIPVFREIECKKIKAVGNNDFNFLLEGDNLHSLKLLEKTHKNSIDLLYIDPPYNTGNKDFFYDDDYVEKDDGFKHSKWLSFMSERLLIARRLLSDEGVVFISIGDDELCNLKILCDEIFGESNFINIISVNMKNIAGASGGGEDKKFKKNLEYLVIYAKDYSFLPLFNNSYNYIELYSLIEQMREEDRSWKYTSVLVDAGQKVYIGSTVDGSGGEIKIYSRKNPQFISVKKIAEKDGITEQEAYYKYYKKIFRTTMPQSSIRPRVMEKVKEIGSEGDFYSIVYVPVSGKNKGKLYEQFYKGDKFNLLAWLDDVVEKKEGAIYKKELNGTYWNHVAGTKNLTKEGKVQFPNGKKPLSLLEQVISLYPSKDITVLDFFAGSGTTGHAIIKLNKDDGGNRKYILCTNNENNICEEVTYQRLCNIQDELPHNLKYFKTDFIPKFPEDEEIVSDRLLLYIKEMVELEHMIEVDSENNIIVLTEDEMEKLFAGKIKDGAFIYIPSYILVSRDQQSIIDKLNLTIVYIPDYYFADELREVGEI